MTKTADRTNGGNGEARPDDDLTAGHHDATLPDKAAFLVQVASRGGLSGSDWQTLVLFLFRIAGLGGSPSIEGWSYNGVFVDGCNLDERTVRRSLSRLERQGLIELSRGWGPGKAARIEIRAPGVVGASKREQRRLKRAKGKPTEGKPVDAAGDRPTNPDNSVRVEPEPGHFCPGNPDNSVRQSLSEGSPFESKEPLDVGVAPATPWGSSSEPPRSGPDPSGSGQAAAGKSRKRRDRGRDPERDRLLKRLQGMARKLGCDDLDEGFLAEIGEEEVGWLLEMQREDNDAQLISTAGGLLADYLGERIGHVHRVLGSPSDEELLKRKSLEERTAEFRANPDRPVRSRVDVQAKLLADLDHGHGQEPGPIPPEPTKGDPMAHPFDDIDRELGLAPEPLAMAALEPVDGLDGWPWCDPAPQEPRPSYGPPRQPSVATLKPPPACVREAIEALAEPPVIEAVAERLSFTSDQLAASLERVQGPTSPKPRASDERITMQASARALGERFGCLRVYA